MRHAGVTEPMDVTVVGHEQTAGTLALESLAVYKLSVRRHQLTFLSTGHHHKPFIHYLLTFYVPGELDPLSF